MMRLKNVALIIGIAIVALILLTSAYLLISPLSYFYVSFKRPLSIEEAIDYLKDNKIDPKEHMVAVDGSTLQEFDSISTVDIGGVNGGRSVHSIVFNTRPYAFKAIIDPRVKSWSIRGPRHPYD